MLVYLKEFFVSLANRSLVGTLITKCDVTDIFAITGRRVDFIHSQREIKEIIDPEKHIFSIKSEHKST